jgi:hypothetical protein
VIKRSVDSVLVALLSFLLFDGSRDSWRLEKFWGVTQPMVRAAILNFKLQAELLLIADSLMS